MLEKQIQRPITEATADRRNNFFQAKRTRANEQKVREIGEWKASLKDTLPHARLIYVGFFAFLIYFLSVVFSTSHLDLLLDTKVQVLWNALEMSRSVVIPVGAWILVVFHYKATWYHARALDQLEGLNKEIRANQRFRVGAQHAGSLLVDIVLPSRASQMARWAAATVLALVLLVAPVFALILAIAVTLPLHSEVTTWSLRVATIVDILVIGVLIHARPTSC